MLELPEGLQEQLQYDMNQCPDLDLDRDLINVSDVLKAHYILAYYFSDNSSGKALDEKMMVGVRSYDLLASAVGRQNVGYGGKRKYTDKKSICATLFYGLVKNHAFHDGNKRTALLILLYQLTEYGIFPLPNEGIPGFEKLVVAIAENTLEQKFSNYWKKFKKNDDPEMSTIIYMLGKFTQGVDSSFHVDITMKDLCKILENIGVKCTLTGQKIKLERRTKRILGEKLQYTIKFGGWTRAVEKKTLKEIEKNLRLKDEYPSISSWADPDNALYKIIGDFEEPLMRLKDK